MSEATYKSCFSTEVVHVFPPRGGENAALELDILMGAMFILCCIHAIKGRNYYRISLLVGGVLLGLVMETASLRLGGTHCHVSGILNVSECSSGNSVLYYGPWVYACVLCAQRLCDSSHWAFSLVCGGLFFGMCGVYEM